MHKHARKKTVLVILLVLIILFGDFFVRNLFNARQTLQSVPEQTRPSQTTNTDTTKPSTSVSTPEIQPTNFGGTVSMRAQGLPQVPSALFNRSDIQVLDLSYNSLTSVQAEVRHLTTLRVLDLSHNTLTNIPAELGQLSNLEILNLSYNKLTGLPFELGNLQKLNILDLRGNNYAKADLAIIRKKLPSTVSILSDIEPSIGGDAQMEYPVP